MDRENTWQFLFDWIVATGLTPEEVMSAVTQFQRSEVVNNDPLQVELDFGKEEPKACLRR